mgnify:CR=1 FL=1
MFLPQRGSLARLMTGAQKVEPAWPAFMRDRASCPIWRPVSCHSVRLNDMPVVMGKANLVVCTRRGRGRRRGAEEGEEKEKGR